MIPHTHKFTLFILAAVLLAGLSFDCFAQAKGEDVVSLRKIVQQLKTENEQLRARVAELEKRADALAIRDHMTQEEQRVENLLSQMVVIGEKEATLQSRMDEVNEQLRPENIDQLPVNGSLRPEEVRESARRRLTNEQTRIRSQIELLQQSRMKLQSSQAVAEMLIQNLRMKLQTVVRP
jgi:cell division protein FtsB